MPPAGAEAVLRPGGGLYIRRWGLEIEHLYQDYSTPTVINHYVLKAGSPNYVLSLPLEIQRSDDKIERFERVETKQ